MELILRIVNGQHFGGEKNMMTVTFLESSLTKKLLNELDAPHVFKLDELSYLNDTIRYMMHYNQEDEDFEKIFNDVLFRKSEGLFYELVGFLVEAYNGSDVVIVFNNYDIAGKTIIEVILHTFQFYFGVWANYILDEDDFNNIKSINNNELFDVANLVKYIDIWLNIHEKISNGYMPNKLIVTQKRGAFAWNNRS